MTPCADSHAIENRSPRGLQAPRDRSNQKVIALRQAELRKVVANWMANWLRMIDPAKNDQKRMVNED